MKTISQIIVYDTEVRNIHLLKREAMRWYKQGNLDDSTKKWIINFFELGQKEFDWYANI